MKNEMKIKNKKINIKKLLTFGFTECEQGYRYTADIVDGQMTITVIVSLNDKMKAMVTDKSTDEEYVLHLAKGAVGAFVGRVRNEYEAIIDSIVKDCFDDEVFKCKQSKQIIDYVAEKYGDKLEFLWEKFPNNAIWRCKNNQKWYGAILTVNANKIGIESAEPIEILDLRIKSEKLDRTIDNVRFFSGYHMNKKHWYTLVLDERISTDEICKRIDDSYELAKKSK